MKGAKSGRPARLEARETIDRVMTERELLAQIIVVAQLQGWLIYHQFEQRNYARRVGVGFPDLVLRRGKRLIFAEVKTEKGTFSQEQTAWNVLLIPGVGETHESYIWRPSDWPKIVLTLTG